jgi:hypothetical protein
MNQRAVEMNQVATGRNLAATRNGMIAVIQVAVAAVTNQVAVDMNQVAGDMNQADGDTNQVTVETNTEARKIGVLHQWTKTADTKLPRWAETRYATNTVRSFTGKLVVKAGEPFGMNMVRISTGK